MENIEDKKIEERKKKIKAWLDDRYNLALVGLLVFSILIRVYYFSITRDQTFWHDEAEYLVMAKHFFFDLPYILNPQRIFLFSWITGLFFVAGLSEHTIRFFLVLVPSLILVWLVYLLGREMFDKKIALIAALLTSISWTLLFWTMRFQPDFLSMCFQLLSILFMWKYWKNPRTSLIIYSGIFASLGFMFKVSGLLVLMVFFVFILFKDRLLAFKNKDYWLFLLFFIIFLIPEFIYAHYTFGNALALFGTSYTTSVTSNIPFGWYNLNYYYLFTENVLFILFLLGVFLSLSFLMYLDILIKNKEKVLNPEIFSLLLFLIVSSYYIFWIKGTDDRWVFIWIPFIFFMVGKASLFVYEYIRKYNKILALIIVLGILIFGIYVQLDHTDSLIKVKKDTYSQVRDASFWIKQNSDPNDLIVSASYPQTVYYSEREVVTFFNYSLGDNYKSDEFDSILLLKKPKYLMVSMFEPSAPSWTYSYPQKKIPGVSFSPVQGWFQDAEQKQPILILYEIDYSTYQPTN